MEKILKYVGLDVHKNSISIATADEGRDSEVRFYGRIDNSMEQLDKIIRKLISQGAEVRCVYEAGPCGYHIYRHLSGNGVDFVELLPRKGDHHLLCSKRRALPGSLPKPRVSSAERNHFFEQ